MISRFARGLRRRLRNQYCRTVLKKMGRGCHISDSVLIPLPRQVSLGDNVVINEGVVLQCCGSAEIQIGNRVAVSYGAMLLTGGIDLETLDTARAHETASIIIGDRAWIGAGAIVLPGVHVGAGAVIAAGAVVTRAVPAEHLVAGIPAAVVRKLAEPEQGGQSVMRASEAAALKCQELPASAMRDLSAGSVTGAHEPRS